MLLAKGSRDAKQIRRLLSLAVIYEGGSRTEAARTGDVGLQVIRDWVLRFNAEGPAGLIDRKAPGAAKKLDPAQRDALAARVEAGPDPARDGVMRWRLADLVDWIGESFAITLDQRTVSRELKAMGFARMTMRPRHHAQEPGVIEDFKKNSPSWSRGLAKHSPTAPG